MDLRTGVRLDDLRLWRQRQQEVLFILQFSANININHRMPKLKYLGVALHVSRR